VAPAAISIDTILHHAKEGLKEEQVTRLNLLENSITRGDVAAQKIHIYHQLSRFWGDTAREFLPYAWYTGEAARLENSEKSLTFAAHLYLDNLKNGASPELKRWLALQAKDLFERSLKINPANDSSKVALGAAYLYGGLSDNPMEGILKIREVIQRDSTNVYAQLTLGQASMVSGQWDKAVERFNKVLQLQPVNLEAVLMSAEAYERMGNVSEALKWYKKSLTLTDISGLKEAVEQKIKELSK
jgi:tetratricopeptide (TPR) repeat protein